MTIKRGVLEVVERKGACRQILLRRVTKKGHDTPPIEGELAADLAALPPAQLHGLEVEYEEDRGRPLRVRRVGAEWQRPPEARPRPVAEGATMQEQPPNGLPSFHNPYNFIPALPRDGVNGELGDGRPAGHHYYHPDKWSGTIRVRMTTKTPLLVPDSAGVTIDEEGHKTFGTRIGPDGRVYLPPTGVKGTLRSAYEAITNSRFGVFGRHDARLAYRMQAEEGLSLVPACVHKDSVALLLGTTDDIPTRRNAKWDVPGKLMYAAWLRRYDPNGNVAADAPRYADGRTLPQHEQEVHVWLQKVQHCRWDERQNNNLGGYFPDFQFWQVIEIREHESELSTTPTPLADPGPPPTDKRGRTYHRPLAAPPIKKKGYVCVTNQNIGGKHDERVFFNDDTVRRPASTTVALSAARLTQLAKAWKELVLDYRAAHRDEDIWDRRDDRRGPVKSPDKYFGYEPGHTAWSRHIYRDGKPRRDTHAPQPDDAELVNGTLCYAFVRLDGGRYEVEALYPVMIARKLFTTPPRDLLPPSLRPSADRARLSPAERVFGWVSQSGEGAYRGNLRVGPVSGPHDAIEYFDGRGVPLAILGEPKVQQVRFYGAADTNGTALTLPQKESGYTARQGLRGRKVYPHHVNLSDDYWKNATEERTQVGHPPQEYRRPHKGVLDGKIFKQNADGTFVLKEGELNEQRDKQNRSIRSWVKPHTTFDFHVHLTNLSDVELGALLWLLTLDDKHYFRLGGGKPLGFGSVRLEIDAVHLANGAQLRREYLRLAGDPIAQLELSAALEMSGGADVQPKRIDGKNGEFESCKKAFTQAVTGACWTGILEAFLAAARGPADGHPIHYPRCWRTQHPDGQNYKWFGENERSGGKPLPELSQNTCLPRYPERQRARGRRGG
jgi:CRISPR-associated protein (TIGR03986 family)